MTPIYKFSSSHSRLFLLICVLLWVSLYQLLQPVSAWLAGHVPEAWGPDLHLALEFFLYETPKILLLLTGVVFVMGLVNSYFTPERTRAFLAGRRAGGANALAALLGVVTPFCSCSAVPLFIGFLQAGIPLGVTFSFLISAPMVNEIALTLLFSLFGWKIGALYMGLGLSLAVVAGWVIGLMGQEKYLEDWVQALPKTQASDASDKVSLADRIDQAMSSVHEIVGRVWLFVVLGIAIGAGVHGYVPDDMMADALGRDAWYAVPLAAIVGVPLYANAASILPIVQALLAKGVALGTALTFMMSVIALSLPEAILLRKVLKPRLLALFMGVVSFGILLVGFVFNTLL